MMNFSLLLVENSQNAKFIAQVLAENTWASFGRHFFKVFFLLYIQFHHCF